MKLWISILFYTLVLTTDAQATKSNRLGENLEDSPQSQELPSESQSSKFDYDITKMEKPPENPKKEQEINPSILTKNYSFSPHIGAGYSSEKYVGYGIGFQYLNFKAKRPLEYAVDLYNNGAAVLGVAHKWFFLGEKNWQSHAKLGLALYLDPDQGVATVLDIDNVLASLQYGWEKYLSPPLALRIDFDMVIGESATIANINFGYSWGF